MEFSNLFFLYLFLPLCVGIYFLAPGMKLKNAVLILFSLLFYSLGRPAYVVILAFLSLFNYFLPKFIRKPIVSLGLLLAVNIGTLVLFRACTKLPFPIGLSFYCFSLIGYGIDVYKNEEENKGSFWQFLLFVSFFPKMIMGPIVRYSGISAQLKERTTDPQAAFCGSFRFAVGLGKKILLADPLFRLYEQLGTHSSWLAGWGAGLAFMLYIYMEFSGYGDMTLGLGKVFGFTLPENFYRPYSSGSIGEFWRRWHISLGAFFRDYVYIPLGGNKKGITRQLVNLLIVWLLTGLWHGMTLTFVIWGLYFFLLLSMEKLLALADVKIRKIPGKIFTFLFVYFGWIIFASKDLNSLWGILRSMFTFRNSGLEPTVLLLSNSGLLLGLGLILSVFGPVLKDWLKIRADKASAQVQKALVFGQVLVIILIFVLCTVSLAGMSAKPSMYGSF